MDAIPCQQAHMKNQKNQDITIPKNFLEIIFNLWNHKIMNFEKEFMWNKQILVSRQKCNFPAIKHSCGVTHTASGKSFNVWQGMERPH